jgi:hypothetical protein
MKPNFRNILLLPLVMCALVSRGQLTVNVLIPPSGLMDKQQLWNIILTNTEQSPLSVQVQASFSDLNTGQPVFTASAGPIIVGMGTKQLSATTVGQVQYNSLNANYRIDPGPTGLLPVGSFSVCYNFLIDKYNKVVQECQPVTISPLGPLLLNQPANGSTLQEYHPLFSWLPPTPVQSLTSLKYDLKLVEVLANQSGADAIQDNIPLMVIRNLSVANYLHAPNAPQLVPEKQYAWQVIATSNLSEIAKSEIWLFSTRQESSASTLKEASPVFIKLTKGSSVGGFAVFKGNLRFDYFNETRDTTWNINVVDITGLQHNGFSLSLDSVRLNRGQNLVDYPAGEDRRFIHGHQYLLQVFNSASEVWQVRFEYRKQD